MSLQLRLLNLALRLVQKPYLARETDVVRARRKLLSGSRLFLGPPGARYSRIDLAGRNGIEARAGPNHGDRVLLWFHGGAYVQGAPETHRKLGAALAKAGDCRVLLPRYRLAPEHPFPAAQADALGCYRALLDRVPAGCIAIGGDSSGGGLAMALLHMMGEAGLPRPACAVAMSPWADMTLTQPSLSQNALADPQLPASRMEEVRDMVLAGADPRDPRASPVFGNFAAAPAALILVGNSEIVRSDAEAMAARLPGAELQIWPDVPHVWPIFYRWLPEANRAVSRVGQFLHTHFATD